MILSMTGYGKTAVAHGNKKITVEVKSLNSKALDLSTRIPAIYREKEMLIRRKLQERLVRGKVDFTIFVESDTTGEAVPVNKALVEHYHKSITALGSELGINLPLDWGTLLHLPDVMGKNECEELSGGEWDIVEQAIDTAIDALIAFRQQEGAALEKMFLEKAANIERLLAMIEPFEKQRVEKIRHKLEESLAQLKGVDYDRNRLEQEMIYYIEKLDISEEKQRLANHLRYFRETLAEAAGQGKKLGFIAQEMGREINTTGSKSNQAEMQNIVVKMKDELEQIKEQVLNVL
ncbi:MAG: YicC family protein [Prevotella sp.]|nr:YicC family protein [Prevotella sp.]